MYDQKILIINELNFNGVTCTHNWLNSLLKNSEVLNPFWV
ncbi:lytic murein transglycosylase [Legionella sp. km535]|nr:lytic murein transglycosylase [Legionella sp. km535]